ncbi:Transcription factor [Botryosphaeria dothidea]|uniref:Transcription factor n=1 Tax=Botryosphaeria dothidea TaxID=55169 RepID=A0A8H4N558_9PEZI|nr:Transcription factor [Botryosphaeria dothidea]
MTPMLYLNTRNKLLSVYGMITDLTKSTWPSSYHDVMQLDRKLQNTRTTMPAGLQLRPLPMSITDHGKTVIRRIHLDLTFHRARCILHRKYLTAARTNAHYEYSRTSCIDAAVQILKHQEVLYREVQPGGWLSQEVWMLTSVLNHDFLLAITILCLDLNYDLELASSSQLVEESAEQERRDKVIHALQDSYKVWVQTVNSSREARKAVEDLRVVLEKARRAPILKSGNRNPDFSGDAAPMNDLSHTSASIPLQSTETYDYETPTNSFPQAFDLFDGSLMQGNVGELNKITQPDGNFDLESWDAHFRSHSSPSLSALHKRNSLLDKRMMHSDLDG